MADYESVLCVKSEVFVYRIPARTSNRGYRAAEWKLDEPDWTGRLKVVAKGQNLTVRLEDRNSGELFAQCPVESYPSSAVEQVLDSSRYFVIRIQDVSGLSIVAGRAAFIGLGFADRGDSFDLLVSLQDHFKQISREENVKKEELDVAAAFNTGPKLDLSFKEGQTITINMPTKKSGENPPSGSAVKQRPRAAGPAGGVLLPPPPGAGTRVTVPIRPSPAMPVAQTSGTGFVSSTNVTSQPAPAVSGDLLNLDFGLPPAPQSSSASQSSSLFGTDWNDFSSQAVQPSQPTKPQSSFPDNNWVNFD